MRPVDPCEILLKTEKVTLAHLMDTIATVLCLARRSAKHDIEAEKAKPAVLSLPNGRRAIQQPDRPDYAISVAK